MSDAIFGVLLEPNISSTNLFASHSDLTNAAKRPLTASHADAKQGCWALPCQKILPAISLCAGLSLVNVARKAVQAAVNMWGWIWAVMHAVLCPRI